ncbi:hypothetical protein FisN_30Lh114 [Fistulifera solaris]|uniref:Uncharacterized protein n=1 Tax=Fistulifera solaris TaxID=1519565 RepID=A0A1Z5JIK4_FISSO|nr:hypothetical protein FisN_30Lh114 [Fistulifera solaris]|eukprot:GAX13819.1 hypothetical protein FisN_30Lh114 [Fistulifera solaris]
MKTQVAVTPMRARQQQSQHPFTSPDTAALLLIDSHSNRFELIQLNSELSETDMLLQIPNIATHSFFRSQRYVGIIGGSSPVRVALPHGMTKRACVRWARSILTTNPVCAMLTKYGYDLQEWFSIRPDLLILLLDLASQRFELVVMDSISTVEECLQQIPVRATDPFLKQQQTYVGLCDPITMEPCQWIEANSAAKENPSMSTVFVAIPKGHSAIECATLARSILATKAVMQTLHSHGFPVPILPSVSNAVVLLLDPHKTRRMECLRLDGLTNPTPTVTHVLEYIRHTAREPALREQSYVALANASGPIATSSLSVLKDSRTWVAVPLGISVRKCRAMARSIYTSDPVQQMLQKHGLDANEWRTPASP